MEGGRYDRESKTDREKKRGKCPPFRRGRIFIAFFFGIFSQLAIGTERTFRWGKIEAKIRDSENVF